MFPYEYKLAFVFFPPPISLIQGPDLKIVQLKPVGNYCLLVVIKDGQSIVPVSRECAVLYLWILSDSRL